MKNLPTFKPTPKQRAWVEIRSDELGLSYTAYLKQLIDMDMKRNKFNLTSAQAAFYMESAEKAGVPFPEWFMDKDEI